MDDLIYEIDVRYGAVSLITWRVLKETPKTWKVEEAAGTWKAVWTKRKSDPRFFVNRPEAVTVLLEQADAVIASRRAALAGMEAARAAFAEKEGLA